MNSATTLMSALRVQWREESNSQNTHQYGYQSIQFNEHTVEFQLSVECILGFSYYTDV